MPAAPDPNCTRAPFDLGAVLRAGDCIVCGQGSAEPLGLTGRLMVMHDTGLPLTVFVGATYSTTFEAKPPPGIRFLSYGALGRAASLADRGLLDVLPLRYSQLADAFRQGMLRADVVLMQLAPAADGRSPNLGLSHDYLVDAARRARVVVAELNPAVPRTAGADLPADLRIDHWVQADRPPLALEPEPPGPVEQAIARHVAGLVPDGATLQAGIGRLPDAALLHLGGHRRLGWHSGVLGDAAGQLVQQGSISNCSKGMDAGVSVTHTVVGSAALYRWVDRNSAVAVRHADHTHDGAVLARLRRFFAINAALQVDLGGQVNCEALGGRSRGGIGGLLDFARAARGCADGGRSITVLPATAGQGRQSRIVASLEGPATLGRADVDLVVTEFGVADLRGATLVQRARRLIAIAAPAFREGLERCWHTSNKGRHT